MSPRVSPGAHSHAFHDLADDMRELLRQSLRFQSVSGNEAPFVRFLADWAAHEGFAVDFWETDEDKLDDYAWPIGKHIPLAGRPTAVIRLPGHSGAPSLIFNAHSDVVAAPEPQSWRLGPWSGADEAGILYGRGACDTKGPLASALWAMTALHRAHPRGLAGDLLLEVVPGEEDCVGLGTLTSLARGWRADAAIILEPTENQPRCASRGGVRFEIVARGRAVHGTVKWLGQDAIQAMRIVLDALQNLEQRFNTIDPDPLFAAYPIARPITVDQLHGGQWQGMIADRCAASGYLELLPGDDLSGYKQRFTEDLAAEVARLRGQPLDLEITFSEEYTGHSTPTDHPLCRTARAAAPGTWSGFNSGCEAGLRFALQDTPTLVWGPGSLAQAHAVDESIPFDDVRRCALLFADVALTFCA